MSKFHISKDGIPRKCHATKKPCPLGGQESHYDNMDDALHASKEQQVKEFGLLPGAPTHKFIRDNSISLRQQAHNWAHELVEHYADEDNRKEGFDYHELFEKADKMPEDILKESNRVMSAMMKDKPSDNHQVNHNNFKSVTLPYLQELEKQGKLAEFDELLANGHKIPDGAYEPEYESTEEEIKKYGSRRQLREWKKDNRDDRRTSKRYEKDLAERILARDRMIANAKFKRDYGKIDETDQYQMTRRWEAMNAAAEKTKREKSLLGRAINRFKLPDLKDWRLLK